MRLRVIPEGSITLAHSQTRVCLSLSLSFFLEGIPRTTYKKANDDDDDEDDDDVVEDERKSREADSMLLDTGQCLRALHARSALKWHTRGCALIDTTVRRYKLSPPSMALVYTLGCLI